MTNETFLDGKCTTRFIDETPALFDLPVRKDRATKLLSYLGEIAVNGNSLVKDRPVATRRIAAPVPVIDSSLPIPDGTRQSVNPKKRWKSTHGVLLAKQEAFTALHIQFHIDKIGVVEVSNFLYGKYLCRHALAWPTPRRVRVDEYDLVLFFSFSQCFFPGAMEKIDALPR